MLLLGRSNPRGRGGWHLHCYYPDIGVSGYISLIMTGELFRKPYLKWRMDLSVLSRTCETVVL